MAASGELAADQDAFERKLYVIRRVAELAAGPDLVIPSFSARTIVYKGMLTAPQLLGYYPDLQDERTKSALALVHSRFSTNTFPSWELAHPYRMIAHNGEINTLRGNVNWMRARESQLASELFGDDLPKVLPIVRPGGSDSATFDNVLELLVLAGRSAAARGDDDDPGGLRGPRRPARGPAGLLRVPLLPDGAVGRPGGGRVHRRPRDRRDARPQRPAPRPLAGDQGRLGRARLGDRRDRRAARERLRKGRLQPGKLFLVDLERGRIVDDGEVKREVASPQPYGEWFEQGIVHLADLPEREPAAPGGPSRCASASSRSATRRRTCGSCSRRPRPRARSRSARWATTSRSRCCSDRQPPLFSYFKQLFAQVTNPPIDPIREAIVMSVSTGVGSERNLLDETPEHAHQLAMQTPILRNASSRSCARSTRRLRGPHARHHVAGRRGPEGMEARSTACAPRPTRRSPTASTS